MSKSISAKSYSKESDSVKRGISKLLLLWRFSIVGWVLSTSSLIMENWFPVIYKVAFKDVGSLFHWAIKLFNVSKVSGCICRVVVEFILRSLFKKGN